MIPSIFHFIYISKGSADPREPFLLVYYLALKSCLEINKPQRINFYYDVEPYGAYWDKIKTKLNLVRVNPSERIYFRKLANIAHKTDILRLQILIKEGGVYADLDTIFVNPLPAYLFLKPFVMAPEGKGRERFGNAFMMSEAHAKFPSVWLRDHLFCYKMPWILAKLFGMKKPSQWCNHSTIYPVVLAKRLSDHIHMEPRESFFKYGPGSNGRKKLFNDVDAELIGVYSIHLWGSSGCNGDILKSLDENTIKTVDTTYNIIARNYL